MAVDDTGTISTFEQAAAQGFLLVPSTTTPVALGASFSRPLAATSDSDPFLVKRSAFGPESLEGSELLYQNQDSGRGSYFSVSTNSSSSSSEHLSLDIGVRVGNKFLGASVSGSYDRAVEEDKSLSKMSLKTSYHAGAVRFQRPPRLSTEAKKLLLPQNGGFEAFTKRFGDYYVAGYIIGGDAAVLVSQSGSRNSSLEKLKVQLQVKIFCFKRKMTPAEKEIIRAFAEEEVNLTAFDSLSGSFASFSARDGNALRFEDAQRLAAECAWRVDEMPFRVGSQLPPMLKDAKSASVLSWSQVNGLAQSPVVSQLMLVPFTTHREVAQHIHT